MERPIITVPRDLLRQTEFNWQIDWRGQESGVSIGGNPLGVVNAFPRWIGEPQMTLHNDLVRRWRAIIGQAQGRLGVFRLPLIDPIGFDWQAAAGALSPNGAQIGNGEYLTTGNGIAYVPMALAVGAVAAGATEFRIDVSPCGIAPVDGQIMSAEDWPFQVTWTQPVSGTLYDIGVVRLATAIEDGGVINMQGHGRFEMRDESQGMASYGPDRHSTPSLAVQEVLRR
ncbi:hypothetical protein ACRARG_12550 [Pseudooceanicola sp. C21-150M6]|uniref:hypothetical protein n=1 Tax=Pseudooceanicola sp. C21-150M6 TaxID=3434355 RepID=UPI003D7F651D